MLSAVPLEFLLVIPCYRERDRLPRFLPRLCETLARSGLRVRVQIVDDGSGPDQQSWLQLYASDLQRRFPFLSPPLLHPDNGGKGHAVYTGWKSEADEPWLAFVDADGAVAPEEVVRVFKQVRAGIEADAVFAVRTGEAGTVVRRNYKRRLTGIGFRRLVARLFAFPVPDTQCGFKVVAAGTYREIRGRLQEERFCFDIELTFRLLEGGFRIASIPISWEESPGSRLGIGSIFSMASTLLKLKRRLGDWKPAEPARDFP
ncbi:MAG: glycosyltransferase [Verrucomicrobiales bacterium]|nr:glycosyltransferase [Verrucomicrobiales bacterium]